MAFDPVQLDHTFSAPIGVDVKGEQWTCVEMPGSREFFGTGKSVRVEATVDGEPLASSFMPTGTGGHMISLNQKIRKKIGKELGDTVTVHLTRRLS